MKLLSIRSIKQAVPHSILAVLKTIKFHRLLAPYYSGCGTILVLHRVLPQTAKPRIKANSRIEITPEFLEELIHFFQNHNYDIISLDELYLRINAIEKKRPFVCFTFLHKRRIFSLTTCSIKHSKLFLRRQCFEYKEYTLGYEWCFNC